ncbi:helix-turn-helix domain-containing protein [Variovorax sp. J22R133]|uniref:GlxA family transcriptional regulator n=1 Tax=Variovorax brevis TaxID=3053503 RepID=UPI002578E0C1|nr:helix-turn-helix domain-containing protein [Variovorax sp. J22R133]MDM0112209.1 helix-turn-helix domain-containing protein [Variovorax sp. J22R133]
MKDAPLPQIAIVATPLSSASVVYGMYEMFKCAGRDWSWVVNGHYGSEVLDPVIVSADGQQVTGCNKLPIRIDMAMPECRSPTVVCVPESLLVPDHRDVGNFRVETAWLRQCHADGALVTSACSGAMLLAEAGLLDGHEATTHWAYCDAMQQRHPAVRVQPKRALITTGEGHRLVMAGGGSSWMDLALYIIARIVDVETAMQVARLILIDWHQVGQQPFARVARSTQVEDALIGRCQTWIADHYADPAPVAAMTELSGLSPRSFQRRFKAATGMAPLDYVHTMRIEEAKHLLETGDLPMAAVAQEVGYDDPAYFGRLFLRQVNLTAPQYRRRFGGMRAALSLHGKLGRETPRIERAMAVA